MKKELTIYNLKELFNLKDSITYTRKITSRIGEKNVLIGSDIFTIKYSLKKGDIIGIFYNGKLLRLKISKVDEVLNKYGISLDLTATEDDYVEKLGYSLNQKESKDKVYLNDITSLPNSSMLKPYTTKKKNFLMGLAYIADKEIRYVVDSKTKEIITLEVNGENIEPTKTNIVRLNEELSNFTFKRDYEVKIEDIHYLEECTKLTTHIDKNTVRGFAVIGKNVIRYNMNKDTRVINSLVINQEIINLDEKTITRANIAIDAIMKGIKEQKGLYTIDDIDTFTSEAIIKKKNLTFGEGFLFKGKEISIRVVFNRKTGVIKDLEYNDKIMPVNKNSIILINNSIRQYEEKHEDKGNAKSMSN